MTATTTLTVSDTAHAFSLAVKHYQKYLDFAEVKLINADEPSDADGWAREVRFAREKVSCLQSGLEATLKMRDGELAARVARAFDVTPDTRLSKTGLTKQHLTTALLYGRWVMTRQLSLMDATDPERAYLGAELSTLNWMLERAHTHQASDLLDLMIESGDAVWLHGLLKRFRARCLGVADGFAFLDLVGFDSFGGL